MEEEEEDLRRRPMADQATRDGNPVCSSSGRGCSQRMDKGRIEWL